MTATNKPKPARSAAPARPPRPLPPRPAADDGGEERTALPEIPGGVLNFTTRPASERAEERSVLFRIDGTEYTVLDNPPAELGLAYLDMVRTRGNVAATPWVMEVMLSPGALEALKGCRDLPLDGLTRVVEVVTEKIIGSLDAPKAG